MLTAQTRITTPRASRYLVQLCRHATALASGTRPHPTLADTRIKAEWCPTQGTIAFGRWGRCSMAADKDRLTVRIQAEDPTRLETIRDIVTGTLGRFDHPGTAPVTWLHSHDADDPTPAPR